MKFGSVPIADSLGGVVAHAVRHDGLTLKKGEVVDAARLGAMRTAGVAEVVVAQLEPGDVGEDEAAARIAQAIAGANLRVERPFTGRANLFAARPGVLLFDSCAIDRINDIDERVTVATLSPFRAVVEGEMIATVKIIPFAAPQVVVESAALAASQANLRVAAFRPQRVGVISTSLPGLKPSVIAKTLKVLEQRLQPAGSTIVCDVRVAHNSPALADAIRGVAPQCDLAVIFGASAITDRRDVIPAAVELAGGRIEQLGMPVDPGNLLLLASIGEAVSRKVILGAPGCARSPRENGFDWVMQRLLADVPVTPADIRRMGAGGLLMEIVSRGQPRGGAEAGGDE